MNQAGPNAFCTSNISVMFYHFASYYGARKAPEQVSLCKTGTKNGGLSQCYLKDQGKRGLNSVLVLPAHPDPRGLGVSAGFPGKGENRQSARVWDFKSCKKSVSVWRKPKNLGSSAEGSLGNPAPISLKSKEVSHLARFTFGSYWRMYFYAKFFWGKTFGFPSLYKAANWNPTLTNPELAM